MKKQNEVYTDLEGFGYYDGGDHMEPADQSDMGSLYHWVFHYNEYSGLWNAFHRDNYNAYWSDRNNSGVISSRSIDTLKELIKKTDGDISKIEKLLGEQ